MISGLSGISCPAVNYVSVKQRKHVASSVFTSLPFAHTRLREREAKEQNTPYKVAKLPVANIPRARMDGDTSGFLKALIDAESNKE